MELKLLTVVILCVCTAGVGSQGNKGQSQAFDNMIEILSQLESNITQYIDERFAALESSLHNDVLSIIDSLNTIQAEHDVLVQQIDDRIDAHDTSMTASLAGIDDKQAALESSLSSQHNDILSVIDSLNTIQAEHGVLVQQIDDRFDAHDTSITASLADIDDKQTALESLLNNRVDDLVGQCVSGNQVLLDTCSACLPPPKIKDCTEVRDAGSTADGVYTIYPTGFEVEGIEVLCDMTTANGGWTVFQRRDSDTDFYRNWTEYENGFGSIGLAGNFWLGNSKIHAITSQGTYELRIDMKGDAASGFEHKAAIYQNFNLGDGATKYTLTFGAFSYDTDYADPGDSLAYHNGRPFSTYDNDNDDDFSNNCVLRFLGAWWHGNCYDSSLNGDWGNTNFGDGPSWWTFYYSVERPLTFTQMMIRRTDP